MFGSPSSGCRRTRSRTSPRSDSLRTTESGSHRRARTAAWTARSRSGSSRFPIIRSSSPPCSCRSPARRHPGPTRSSWATRPPPPPIGRLAQRRDPRAPTGEKRNGGRAPPFRDQIGQLSTASIVFGRFSVGHPVHRDTPVGATVDAIIGRQWYEGVVVMGIDRNRVRGSPGGPRGHSWDNLDQLLAFRVDDAEHRALGVVAGSRVVKSVVEPDLVGSPNAWSVGRFARYRFHAHLLVG